METDNTSKKRKVAPSKKKSGNQKKRKQMIAYVVEKPSTVARMKIMTELETFAKSNPSTKWTNEQIVQLFKPMIKAPISEWKVFETDRCLEIMNIISWSQEIEQTHEKLFQKISAFKSNRSIKYKPYIASSTPPKGVEASSIHKQVKNMLSKQPQKWPKGEVDEMVNLLKGVVSICAQFGSESGNDCAQFAAIWHAYYSSRPELMRILDPEIVICDRTGNDGGLLLAVGAYVAPLGVAGPTPLPLVAADGGPAVNSNHAWSFPNSISAAAFMGFVRGHCVSAGQPLPRFHYSQNAVLPVVWT